MVGGFLSQMWSLFHKFISGLTTVAISYEDRKAMELPSLAFCDSRGFSKSSAKIANATQYNATTFNLENEVTLTGVTMSEVNVTADGTKTGYSELDNWQNSYSTLYVPTVYNGNCKLYEFHTDYPTKSWTG